MPVHFDQFVPKTSCGASYNEIAELGNSDSTVSQRYLW